MNTEFSSLHGPASGEDLQARIEHYILDGHTAIPCDMMTWARWLQADKDRRIVAKSDVDGARVSTVFLGLDHSYGIGPPLLFETLVFDGPHDGDMERCTTWEEAEAQHAAMCAKLKGQP